MHLPTIYRRALVGVRLKMLGSFPQLRFNRKASDRLRQLCAGQTVAIVGSAPDLLDARLGKTIDQHGVVVRINLLVTTALEDHLGRRTDIRFLGSTLSESHVDRLQKIAGNCMLIASEKNRSLLEREQITAEYYHSRLPLASFRIFKKFGWIPPKNHRIDKPPRSGLVALALLLAHGGARKVYLYGFSRSVAESSRTIHYRSQSVVQYSDAHLDRNHCPAQVELDILNHLEAAGTVIRVGPSQVTQ